MLAKIKNNVNTKFRFALVGGANTAIDFGVLFILAAFGVPAIAANICSTTTAFSFSFFANKRYTFKTTGTNVKRELILFLITTLFGLWVLQSIAIELLLPSIEKLAPEGIALALAKVGASFISLTWNYFMYSRVVFKPNNDNVIDLEK